MLTFDQVASKAQNMEARYADRDQRMLAVREVRNGRMRGVFPELFSGTLDQPMVANFIDTVARDFAESIAPLPALTCTSGVATSDRAKQFAVKRQRIGASYWEDSNLELQMMPAADNYITYSFTVGIVEPDFEARKPRIRLLNPFGCYPEFNLEGNCVSLTRKWSANVEALAAQYPGRAAQLKMDAASTFTGHRDVDVFQYVDRDQYVVWCNVGDKAVQLDQWENRLGECPVECAVRPSGDGEMRGQFDDVLGVQAARAIMMRLMLEATEKQVQAPIALPDDVQELAIGPDALIRTQSPQNVRRVDLSVNPQTFAQIQQLDAEMKSGSRYPEVRGGSLDASIITGRGVQALQGGYDSQIRMAQLVFCHMLRRLTAVAFHMDEVFWPNDRKEVRGTAEGTPFDITYVPSRDINGDYTCEVTYGMLTGIDPSRALVFLLQLRGDKAIPRSLLQKHLPFDVDLVAVQQEIDTEEMRDAVTQGVLSLAQSIGPMAQAGQDPKEILQIIAAAVSARQKGVPIEEALSQALDVLAARRAEAAEQQQEAMMQGQGPEGGMPGGMPPGGGGQPAGRPSVQQLLASLGASGQPNLSAGVRRTIPM